MRKSRLSAIVAALLMTASVNALADNPSYIGYPAPGGNSASGSGLGTTKAGGKTWAYSGFDSLAYGDLYYGIGSYSGATFLIGEPTLYEQSTPPPLSSLSFNAGLSDLTSGIAVWSGATRVPTTYGATMLYTEFVLKVTDSSSNALSLDDPTLHGLASSAGAVLHVTGDFNANWQFLASTSGNAGTFSAAGPLYDSLSLKLPTDVLMSNVGGAFYATPYVATAPVPEPETYAMMLAGLGLLASVAKRRKGREG